MRSQLRQLENRKIPDFHLFGKQRVLLPISPAVYIYQWGLNHHDTTRILRKRARIQVKYNNKIEDARSLRRKNTLRNKKIQRTERLDKKLNEGNQFMRWGEPLSVFDSALLIQSVENLKAYLYSKGFFDSEVEYKKKTTQKHVSIDYTVTEGQPYRIDSMIYAIPDSSFRRLFMRHIGGQLLEGETYDQSLFTQERNRIFDIATNSGYYQFKRQYVVFEVDSMMLGDHRLVVRQTVANPSNKDAHVKYHLDSIIFTAQSKNLNTGYEVSQFNGSTYRFLGDNYPKELLDSRIFMHKDSLYRKRDALATQRQLSYLDVFKFVNISYDSLDEKFVANIYTSPLKKFQTSSEVGLSMFSNTDARPGPFVNLNTKSRNVFGGLELFQLDGKASIQGVQGVTDDDKPYSRLVYGGLASLTFPQFIAPLPAFIRENAGFYNPRTKVSAGVNFEERQAEYERTTFNAGLSYIWQKDDQAQYTFRPTDISYILSKNTPAFQRELNELEELGQFSLVNTFRSAFVSYSSFAATFNENGYGVGNATANYLQASIESGGNIHALWKEERFFEDSLATYRYVKASIDIRKSYRISLSSGLAYRLRAGAALGYGINNSLPYEKYFFAGGSNSVRAWDPRRLGPGAYAAYEEINEDGTITVNDNIEKQGDLILEASIEYRADLIGFIDYAFFIDAGNIWLWNSRTVDETKDGSTSDSANPDDGIFRLRQFPREIAVGVGYGLRFDFSFLVFRLDVGYKAVDPAYPLGERIRAGKLKLNEIWNFKDKANLNIGIGYPF